MSLKQALKQYGLVALAIPGLLLLTGISTLADATPSAPGSPALPGDPIKGQALYGQNCATCHGANLEGGIGAVLNPIDKLPQVSNPLDSTFIIALITNGRTPQPGDPRSIAMPVKGGNPNLTDQDIKDLAAYIIQQNAIGIGNVPLSPNELAKRTMFWVGVGIIGMVFITYLLAQYNMRWIARRAAARRK